MFKTQAEFDEWQALVVDRIEMWMDDEGLDLDYSPDSLADLESRLLRTHESFNAEEDNEDLWLASMYIGEVMNRSLGTNWHVNLTDDRDVWFGWPVVVGRGVAVYCPFALVTASLSRRTGRYLTGVLNKAQARLGQPPT